MQPPPGAYEAVLARQHARIAELEAALAAAESRLVSLRSAPLATLATLAAADDTTTDTPALGPAVHQTASALMAPGGHSGTSLTGRNWLGAAGIGRGAENAIPGTTAGTTATAITGVLPGLPPPPHPPPLPPPPPPVSASSDPAFDAAHHHHHPHHLGHLHHAMSQTRYWTELEHAQFLRAVQMFGPKNYVAISNYVATRTPKQVRSHSQKYQLRLAREARKRSHTPALGITRPDNHHHHNHLHHYQLSDPSNFGHAGQHHELGPHIQSTAYTTQRASKRRSLKSPPASPSSPTIAHSPNTSQTTDTMQAAAQDHPSHADTTQSDQSHPPRPASATQGPPQSLSSSGTASGPPVSFAPRKRRPWRTSVEGIVA